MATFSVAFSRASTLVESRFPLRCADRATGDPVVVYPEIENDSLEEYDEERTTTSGHPDDGWYFYEIRRYHFPDPDGHEIGCIELISDQSSYDVVVSIKRTKPFNRAYNAYWTCVSAFFEELKQALGQEEAAIHRSAGFKQMPLSRAPTSPTLLPPGTMEPAAQRREFQLTFYGTPAEFGAIVALFGQHQAPRFGGDLFQVRAPVSADAPLVQIWVYDRAASQKCVGSITAQQLPHGSTRLVVQTDETHLAALNASWDGLRTELEQQGWIDAREQVPEDARIQLSSSHLNLAHANDEANDEANAVTKRNSGKFARDYEGRRQAVAMYREAHRRGQIGVNKDTWASIHLGISGRTLLNWEHEFPEEA